MARKRTGASVSQSTSKGCSYNLFIKAFGGGFIEMEGPLLFSSRKMCDLRPQRDFQVYLYQPLTAEAILIRKERKQAKFV